MQFDFNPERVILLLEPGYPLAAAQKCFYWYTRDYFVEVSELPNGHIRVGLQPKTAGSWPLPAEALRAQLHNELLDFEVREAVADETQTIRELLLAKAFAHYEVLQPLVAPISDPVGFHPLAEGQR